MSKQETFSLNYLPSKVYNLEMNFKAPKLDFYEFSPKRDNLSKICKQFQNYQESAKFKYIEPAYKQTLQNTLILEKKIVESQNIEDENNENLNKNYYSQDKAIELNLNKEQTKKFLALNQQHESTHQIFCHIPPKSLMNIPKNQAVTFQVRIGMLIKQKISDYFEEQNNLFQQKIEPNLENQESNMNNDTKTETYLFQNRSKLFIPSLKQYRKQVSNHSQDHYFPKTIYDNRNCSTTKARNSLSRQELQFSPQAKTQLTQQNTRPTTENKPIHKKLTETRQFSTTQKTETVAGKFNYPIVVPSTAINPLRNSSLKQNSGYFVKPNLLKFIDLKNLRSVDKSGEIFFSGKFLKQNQKNRLFSSQDQNRFFNQAKPNNDFFKCSVAKPCYLNQNPKQHHKFNNKSALDNIKNTPQLLKIQN